MEIRPFTDADSETWDRFCAAAPQATFLHSRRFLSYHGNRFLDRSVILCEDDRWVAVLPAAEQPGNAQVVVSHPGITYGGLITSPKLYGERVVTALGEVAKYYSELGYARFVYKAVPYIYHGIPVQEDLYALSRLGAVRHRCDLSSTIDLNRRGPVSDRRKRSYKKAIAAGVTIARGGEWLEPFWNVLEDNLQRKHGVAPVHSLQEIQTLADRFPSEINVAVALCQGEVVAGVVLFESSMVSHAQYIASSETGYALGALDPVFEHCIQHALNSGKRFFDFGNSNEDQGRILNQSLLQFKREFGTGSVAYEFYETKLASQACLAA